MKASHAVLKVISIHTQANTVRQQDRAEQVLEMYADEEYYQFWRPREIDLAAEAAAGRHRARRTEDTE